MVDFEGHDIVRQGVVEGVGLHGDHHAVAHQTVEHRYHGGEGGHAEGDAPEMFTAEEFSTLVEIQTLVGTVVGEHSSIIGPRTTADQGRKSQGDNPSRGAGTFGPTARWSRAPIVESAFSSF